MTNKKEIIDEYEKVISKIRKLYQWITIEILIIILSLGFIILLVWLSIFINENFFMLAFFLVPAFSFLILFLFLLGADEPHACLIDSFKSVSRLRDERKLIEQSLKAGFISVSQKKRMQELGYSTIAEFKQKTGFSSEAEMSQINKYGYKTKEEFTKATGFNSHKQYSEMLNKGFKNKLEWELAKKGGFEKKAEWELAKKGGFEKKAEWELAKKGNFLTKDEYELAQSLTMKNKKDLLQTLTREIEHIKLNIEQTRKRLNVSTLILATYDIKQLESYDRDLSSLRSQASKTIPDSILEIGDNSRISSRAVVFTDTSAMSIDTKRHIYLSRLEVVQNKTFQKNLKECREIGYDFDQRVSHLENMLSARKEYLKIWYKIMELLKNFRPEIPVNLTRIVDLIKIPTEDVEKYLLSITSIMPDVGEYLSLEQVFIRHYSTEEEFQDIFEKMQKKQKEFVKTKVLEKVCVYCQTKIKTKSTEIEKCQNCGKKPPICSICMQNLYLNDDIVIEKNCKNTFHKRHIVAWIRSSNKCPICLERINEQSLKTFEN
ncbi:MAG: RING finger protein [Candidatus Heimdallarchaeaceae archaeon]